MKDQKEQRQDRTWKRGR